MTFMDDKMFSELLESVREAKDIQRGVKEAPRRVMVKFPDAKQIRSGLGLTQDQFAALIGVSVRTLQNWEQGRRQPEGPARALLIVTARNPTAVLEALYLEKTAV